MKANSTQLEPARVIATLDLPAGRSWTKRLRALYQSSYGQNLMGVIDQGIVSAASFITMLVVGRVCGASELGRLALAVSLVVMINAVQDALISIPFTISYSQTPIERRSRYAGNTLVQVIALIVFATLGVVIAASWLRWTSFHSGAGVMLVLVLVVPGVVVRQFVRRYLFARRQIRQAVIFDTSVVTLQVTVLAVLIGIAWLSARSVLLAIGGASLAVGGIWLWSRRRELRPLHQEAVADLHRHWRLGRWLVGGEMLSVASGSAAYWIIALTMDTAATGQFAACSVIVQLANPFLLGVGNVLEGRAASEFASGGWGALRQELTRAARLYCGATGLFAIFAAFFGALVVGQLYGTEYARHGLVVALLAASVFTVSCGTAFSCGLRIIGRADLTFLACAIDVATLVIGALLMASRWGLEGVALAVLGGSLAGTAVRIAAFRRLTRQPKLSGEWSDDALVIAKNEA